MVLTSPEKRVLSPSSTLPININNNNNNQVIGLEILLLNIEEKYFDRSMEV